MSGSNVPSYTSCTVPILSAACGLTAWPASADPPSSASATATPDRLTRRRISTFSGKDVTRSEGKPAAPLNLPGGAARRRHQERRGPYVARSVVPVHVVEHVEPFEIELQPPSFAQVHHLVEPHVDTFGGI